MKSTDFEGKFTFNKPLDDALYKLLKGISETRRMKRDISGYGTEGEFYIAGTGLCGQNHDSTVIDYNEPPSTQPSLWCAWTPTENRQYLQWNGMEKTHHYVEWLKYLIAKLLIPEYSISGEVTWQGGDSDDFGKIVIQDNIITVQKGRKTYGAKEKYVLVAYDTPKDQQALGELQNIGIDVDELHFGNGQEFYLEDKWISNTEFKRWLEKFNGKV